MVHSAEQQVHGIALRRPFLHPLPFQHRIPDLFGSLVSARGDMRFHQMLALESIVHRRFGQSVSEWLRHVRSASVLVEGAFQEHPRLVAPVVVSCVNGQAEVSMEVSHLGEAAIRSSTEDGPDRRFRPLLDFYQCLYERYYPRLIAPFLVAHRLSLGDGELSGNVVEDDGRVSLARVAEMEQARGVAGLLTAGMDRHLRNSTAHGRYQISEHSIRMEDRNPAGNTTWGPHHFTHPELRGHVFLLMDTCDALLAALILFGVNNDRLIAERDFVKHVPRRSRVDVVRASLERLAETYLGLEVVSVEVEPLLDVLHVTVKALGQTMLDQDSEIVEGGGRGRPRKWIQRITTEQAPVREQVYALIQQTFDLHETFELLQVDFVDETGVLGKIVADQEGRRLIRDGVESADELQGRMREDSLPEIEIPVVIREFPREV